jgi:hypothetical protein
MSDWSFDYSIDVDTEQAVIYVKIFGQWTTETAENYHRDFRKEAEALSGRQWAKLVDLTNWKTSRHEVTEVVGKHMAWSKRSENLLSIYVINNTSTYRQLGEMFARGGTKETSHTFRTRAEADAFLKEHWLDREK